MYSKSASPFIRIKLFRLLHRTLTKRPKQDPQQNTLFLTAGGSGDFGDAERHAPKPYCTARSLERANERPGIWRPQRRIHYMCGAWSNVSALPLKEAKRPKQDPHKLSYFKEAGDSGIFGDNGNMLRSPASQ